MKKYFAIILLAATVLVGCKSTKQVATEVTTPAEYTDSQAFDAVVESYASWSDVQVPVTLTTTKPQKFSLSGNATIVRGRDVHMSFRVMGFEVAVLHINRDSVFLADKVHKYLYAESYAKVFAGYPVTINDIQDVLLGRACLLEQGTLRSDLRQKVNFDRLSASTWAMQPRKQPKGIDLTYTFGAAQAIADAPVMTSIDFSPKGRNPVSILYSEYVRAIAGPVPSDLSVTAPVGKHALRGTIEFNHNKAKWNTGKTTTWKRPGGYQLFNNSNLTQLLKSF